MFDGNPISYLKIYGLYEIAHRLSKTYKKSVTNFTLKVIKAKRHMGQES
jgi:hypothetical protein